MTVIFSINNLLFSSICLIWQFTVSQALYSRAWCPYQTEKVVPCKVRNGTEPYVGPNICWKTINGSFSCTKKILHRPKYVTTYKRVFETRYRCCPGMEGSDCQRECFNCSSYETLIKRVNKLEEKVNQITERKEAVVESNQLITSPSFTRTFQGQNNNVVTSVDTENTPLTAIAVNTRITNLLNEFRDMESRLQGLEEEVHRLSAAMDDQLRHIHREAAPLTLGPPTTSLRPPENITERDKEEEARSPVPVLTVRQLEENLDRGDIASTVNDDYGDELLFDNSTEEYADPLSRIFH